MNSRKELLEALKSFVNQTELFESKIDAFEKEILAQTNDFELKKFFQFKMKVIKSRIQNGKYQHRLAIKNKVNKKETNNLTKKNKPKSNTFRKINKRKNKLKKTIKKLINNSHSENEAFWNKLNGIKKTKGQIAAIKKRQDAYKVERTITTKSSIWTVKKK